jgi:peptidoglycan hydrolase CwlO-like protein
LTRARTRSAPEASKLQLADLQNDISRMESAMLDNDRQIEEAKQELEELKTKISSKKYSTKVREEKPRYERGRL